jgi:cell division protein FtsB
MELTYLGKYGLKQNKALSMLYCMVALGTRRKQLSALNLDIGYMSEFEEKQESVIEKVQDADALKAEIEKLRKEGQQLRSALHSAEKTNNDLRKKLSKLQEQSKAEHRELSDLREIVFKSDTPEPEETEEISTVEFPYTVLKTTVVFGGHDTWVKAIRPLLKGDIKFVPREMKIDVSLVKNADVIWIQTNAIPHRSYYSIVDTARKYRKPIRYFTFASASKCANQVVCNDII